MHTRHLLALYLQYIRFPFSELVNRQVDLFSFMEPYSILQIRLVQFQFGNGCCEWDRIIIPYFSPILIGNLSIPYGMK